MEGGHQGRGKGGRSGRTAWAKVERQGPQWDTGGGEYIRPPEGFFDLTSPFLSS